MGRALQTDEGTAQFLNIMKEENMNYTHEDEEQDNGRSFANDI
jgi:hypothetical protein